MKKKKKMRKSSNTIASSKPFRRARTKIKKPKFLSLSAASAKLQTHPNNNNNNKTQPGSFPGHPDDDPPELSMADHMFAEAEGPTTLTGLLNGVVSSSATTTTTTSGVSYAEAHEYDSAARSLVRTAMRREREEGGGGGGEEEEKWVSISEVVVETAEEEVTSGGGGGLWLKLDYEGVLNAWTRKEKGGPFCGVGAEEEDQEELPQTVPDMDQYGVVSGTPFWGVRNKEHWSVPENNFNVQHSGNYSQTGGSTGEEAWKMGIREASVLRYKEKRRNRLFAKRIRYEVRKLNAEKRPRIKGRFVRRGGD